ncbi:MAG: M61 family metallopeptidase [Gammaproteobacteria bacterium]|nr:M61 family metallopeptidase [Gammaproteobacteria bacterium]
MLKYQVSLHSPEAHVFRVKMFVPEPLGRELMIGMPAWIPGSYMIRDYARNILSIKAESGDGALQLIKKDKQTWLLTHSGSPIVITYYVYAWDLSVRGSFLDTTRAFITGTSLFLFVRGMEQHNCEIEFSHPLGEIYSTWRLATTLEPVNTRYLQFGTYHADSYEALIDHPIEMGNFSHTEFLVSGVKHNIQISGVHDADLEKLSVDLERICTEHIKLFDGLPDMERYLFQVMAVGEGYGGLEHRCSTSLICSRRDLPHKTQTKVDEGYRRFLGLCSHEYFHLWNVKRIRPQVLKESDLSKEVHTTLLWVFEGITSYFDDLALVRSGVIEQQGYLDLLARTITRYLAGTGRFKQTLAESSFDAWTKFYKQDENAPNAIVSYYTKGALVALLLDMTLRRNSGNRVSMNHVMRRLWKEYGEKEVGIEEGVVERIVEELTGSDFHDFFESYVYGVDELPLEGMLKRFGVAMHLAPTTTREEKGGYLESFVPVNNPVFDLGVKVSQKGEGLGALTVYEGGPAQQAGLSAGDVIIAINGIKATTDEWSAVLERYQQGEKIVLHAFRRDELISFQVTPVRSEFRICYLQLDSAASPEAGKAREAWLGPQNHACDGQ